MQGFFSEDYKTITYNVIQKHVRDHIKMTSTTFLFPEENMLEFHVMTLDAIISVCTIVFCFCLRTIIDSAHKNIYFIHRVMVKSQGLMLPVGWTSV